MSVENGVWIMYGADESDPYCLKNVDQLLALVDELGFLPLFRCEIPGLSVEERTPAHWWWTDDPRFDPWLWRQQAAATGKVAYGKFFGGKAGFVSREWFPYFANWRRDGYDFDARWDEGLCNLRSKKIMDCFMQYPQLFSYEAKRFAGFGKEGEKNFSGILTQLQMETYLLLRDFRCRINKRGEPYGWPIAVLSTPESLWGEEHICSAYKEGPQESLDRMLRHFEERYPIAEPKQVKKLLGRK